MSTGYYTVTLYYTGNYLTEKKTVYSTPDSPPNIDFWISPDYSIDLNVSNRPFKIIYTDGKILTIHYTGTGQLSYIVSSESDDKIIYEYNDDNILIKKIKETKEFVPGQLTKVPYCIYLDEKSSSTFSNCSFLVKANAYQVFQLDRDSSCYIENCNIDTDYNDIDYVVNCFKNRLDMLQTSFVNVTNKLLHIDAGVVRFNDSSTIEGNQITSDNCVVVNELFNIIS